MEPRFDLASCLASIPDRRRAEGKMYGQVGVILFSIIAMLSGARSYRQIHALIDRRLALRPPAFRLFAASESRRHPPWPAVADTPALRRRHRTTHARSAAPRTRDRSLPTRRPSRHPDVCGSDPSVLDADPLRNAALRLRHPAQQPRRGVVTPVTTISLLALQILGIEASPGILGIGAGSAFGLLLTASF